jgi:hypothetical protein
MGAPPGLGPIVATIWHAFAARPHPAIQQSRAARLAAIIFIVEFTQQFLIVGSAGHIGETCMRENGAVPG